MSLRATAKAELSPLAVRIARTVEKGGLFRRGDRILVAVSGGPDSVALLALLSELAPSWGLHLSVVHVNHGLRGEEAEEDCRFVAELCEQFRVQFLIEHAPVDRASPSRGDQPVQRPKKSLSLQEAAREARYAAFLRAGRKLGVARIALGHTADDQAETLLMWMLRGAGLAGLSGMPAARTPFIRPLLRVTRSEILGYLEARGIPFREDSSNAKRLYLRNRVRHDLLPLLKRFNPAIVEVLGRQAEILREEDQYLEALATARMAQLAKTDLNHGIVLDRNALLSLPLALQRRVIRLTVRQAWKSPQGPSFSVIQAILDQVVQACSGSRLTLPELLVAREYDQIRFQPRPAGVQAPEAAHISVDLPLPVPSSLIWPLTGQEIRARLEIRGQAELRVRQNEAYQVADQTGVLQRTRPRNVARFDADSFTCSLRVRTWQPGDAFRPVGMSGRQKKLKDYFADLKVPRERRQRIPLVVSPEGILWIAGYRADHRFRVTPETKRILLLELWDRAELEGTG